MLIRIMFNRKREGTLLSLGIATLTCAAPEEPAALDFQGFQHCLLATKQPWWGVLLSSVLHCALVAAIPFVSVYLPEIADEQPRWRVVSIEPLQFRVPDRLFYAAARPKPVETAQTNARAGEPIAKPGAVEKPGGAVQAARRFELPELPRKAESEQTILQPQFPLDLPVSHDATLPQIMFWAARMPTPKRPPPKKFVMPGREMPSRTVPELSAPPKLETPNAEVLGSDLKFASSVLVPDDAARLVKRPGTPMPVRVFAPPAPKPIEDPSIDVQPGEGSNLVAFNPNIIPITPVLIVPAVNQIGVLPPPGDGDGGANQGSVAGSKAGEGAGPNMEESGGGNAGGQIAAQGDGAVGPGSLEGSGTGDLGAKPLAVGGGGPRAALAIPPAALSLNANSIPIRIVHPENGVFDMVVVQSSPLDIPEGRGLLKGQPVYTVYLKLGTPKEWILQYCVPESTDGVRNSGRVVQLGNPAPVKSPFPRNTVTPPLAVLAKGSRTVVHGILDSHGQFRELKAVRQEDEAFVTRIIPFLEQWEFRPATRDGMPVGVEMLLVIPPLEI
jgi:hypothetical protein